MPKRTELTERGIGGVWAAMGRHGGVDEWRKVVADHLSTPVAPVIVETASPVAVDAVAETPVPREHIEIAAFFLFQNGHPGTPDDHWREAERKLATA